VSLVDRDGASTDALLTDLYLDALLAGAVLDEAAGRTSTGGEASATLDPAARGAAHRLRDDLVRIHPSFRFEERLAARLAEAAVAMRLPAAAGAEGRVIPFRTPVLDPDLLAPDELDPRSAGRDLNRPLLIGGALTSAALSIAGAAFVAWRRGRPARAAPMVKAARTARASRARRTTPLGPLTAAMDRPRRRSNRSERPD
jgi:hypothetical protein